MKFATKIGLAAAAVALIAMLGAASASAYQTVLCKESKQAPYCKGSERFPKNTAISASPGFPAETVSIEGAVEVTCSASTITGKTTAEAGEPLPVSISAWTLGGCERTNGKPCTVTALESAPYSGSLNRTSGSNGTMSVSSGGKGNPGWTIHCGVVLNCTWTLEPGFAYEGLPGHAEMIAKKLPLTRKSGICPETATFTGTYIVNSPAPARLAIPKEAPTNPATALCKSADSFYCEPGDLYESGTVLKAPITEPVLVTSGEYAYGDFSCSSGVLQAETTADYGEHLPVTVALDSLSSCHSEGLGSCTISSLEPGSGSITRQPDGENLLTGDGSWSQYFGVSLYIQCGSHECEIGIEAGEATLIHGEPAKIEGIFNWGSPQGSSYCPEYMKLEFGELTLSSPSGLVVTDALR